MRHCVVFSAGRPCNEWLDQRVALTPAKIAGPCRGYRMDIPITIRAVILAFSFLCHHVIGEDTLAEPCPTAHTLEDVPENCEWIIEDAAKSLRCPIPVLMCHGATTPANTTVQSTPSSITPTTNETSPSLNFTINNTTAIEIITLEKPPCGEHGCEKGYVCMKDMSRMSFIHAGFNEAKCVRAHASGAGLCPMPFVHPASGTCSPNCQTDHDCSKAQMCCDIGCGLRCSRVTPPCEDKAIPLPLLPHCHIEVTQGPLGHTCRNVNLYCIDRENGTVLAMPMSTLDEIVTDHSESQTNGTPPSDLSSTNRTSAEDPSLDARSQNQSQKELGSFCDEGTCPEHLMCIEMVKHHAENGTKVRRAICQRTNNNRTKLCPAPDLNDTGAEDCISDCVSDADCAHGESCCDLGCGMRCSRMKPTCNGRQMRKDTSGRTCYHEEIVTEDEGSCRKIRMVCKRPPWRSKNPSLALQQRRTATELASSSERLAPQSTTSESRANNTCIKEGCTGSNHVCLDDALTGHSQCVRVDAVGAGMCPIAPPMKDCPDGLGKSECASDDQCPTGSLCCPIGCGLSTCATPKPACDAKPIRSMSPNCYFERLPNDGHVACHNLRLVCYDEFDPSGARTGYVSSYNGPAPLGAEETMSGVRSRFRKP